MTIDRVLEKQNMERGLLLMQGGDNIVGSTEHARKRTDNICKNRIVDYPIIYGHHLIALRLYIQCQLPL